MIFANLRACIKKKYRITKLIKTMYTIVILYFLKVLNMLNAKLSSTLKISSSITWNKPVIFKCRQKWLLRQHISPVWLVAKNSNLQMHYFLIEKKLVIYRGALVKFVVLGSHPIHNLKSIIRKPTITIKTFRQIKQNWMRYTFKIKNQKNLMNLKSNSCKNKRRKNQKGYIDRKIIKRNSKSLSK